MSITHDAFKALAILQGNYNDFNSMWYIDVGTQLIFAMFIEIFEPHVVPFVMYSWF